jgi:hypothetical protein
MTDINKHTALSYTIRCIQGETTSDALPFVILSCNTDVKNIKRGRKKINMRGKVAAYVGEYKDVHAYIDACHRVLKCTLSTRVEVDTRVGRGGKGIHQEPLERVLEYLGLSMKADQVVNASIDGLEGVTRALIPFHLLCAERWHLQYNRTRFNSL